MKIIPFEDKYLKDIEDINVAVSSHPNRPLPQKKLFQYLYIDYYAINSKENCFVAIQQDQVVGYIICEPNFNRYKDIILNKYMEEAIKLCSDFELYLKNEVSTYEEKKDLYPAHLHMDVKPGFQHQGIGTALIEAELNHLKSINCEGVMLLCSKDNIKANNFYEKNGLKIIEETGCNIRGTKL